jgi:hypothetical protein
MPSLPSRRVASNIVVRENRTFSVFAYSVTAASAAALGADAVFAYTVDITGVLETS